MNWQEYFREIKQLHNEISEDIIKILSDYPNNSYTFSNPIFVEYKGTVFDIAQIQSSDGEIYLVDNPDKPFNVLTFSWLSIEEQAFILARLGGDINPQQDDTNDLK